MHLSVVIPLYNEAQSLAPLYQELMEVELPQGTVLELIFVDDGSTDESWHQITRLSESDPRVKGIRLRKNFGKSEALQAGFREAVGEVIVTLDADLQDDPREVPRLLRALEQGYDLVNGWKKFRRDAWHRRWTSKLFNFLVNRLTGVYLHDHNCGMKCYRAQVLREIRVQGELHRFLPVLAAARGFRVGELEVHHRPRKYGSSKYGWERIPQGLIDMVTVACLTKYRGRPQHFVGLLGLVLFLAGSLGTLGLTLAWFLSRAGSGGTPIHLHERALFYYSLAGLVLGAQLLSLGFLATLFTWRFEPAQPLFSILERTPPQGTARCRTVESDATNPSST